MVEYLVNNFSMEVEKILKCVERLFINTTTIPT